MRRPIVIAAISISLCLVSAAFGQSRDVLVKTDREVPITNREFLKSFVSPLDLSIPVIPTIIRAGDRDFYGSSIRLFQSNSGAKLDEVRVEGGVLKDEDTTGAIIKLTARW